VKQLQIVITFAWIRLRVGNLPRLYITLLTFSWWNHSRINYGYWLFRITEVSQIKI